MPEFARMCSENKMCIDQRLCTGCGKCVPVCTFDAITEIDPDQPCLKCGSRAVDCAH